MDSDMLSYVFSDRVLYQCTCGLRRPLRRIYFCKHCLKLRCGNCVSHEVDTHFCPNCMENMPSAEARLKRNRCANCFDCPSCLNTLSTRASSVLSPSPDDPTKTIPKKVYYLACGFCRWTSRDIGLQDKPVASGGWPEIENPHAKQIGLLLEHYRAMAQREKADRDRKKTPKRRAYIYFSDKYGVTTAIARKRAGLPPSGNLSLKEDVDGKVLEFEPPKAHDDPEPLPEEYWTQPVHLHEVCNISQRLSQPEYQPVFTKDMCPNHKLLVNKQSHRCKECEHNLCKPEYSATSIKFKIQLAAHYHFPQVQVYRLPKFYGEQACSMVLTLTNPSQNACAVFLLPLNESNDPLVTADAHLPAHQIRLCAHDDAAEFDEVADTQPACKEDPRSRSKPMLESFVRVPGLLFTKANTVGVHIQVTPRKGEDEARVAFRLKWDYCQTAIPVQGDVVREAQLVWLEARIDLILGNVSVH